MSRSYFTYIVSVLSVVSASLAIEEMEPNNTEDSANPVEDILILTGELDSGGARDYFQIDDISDFPFALEAEARIVSGPLQNSESFDFQFIGRGQDITTLSTPTGTGSRRISFDQPGFGIAFLGPLYLRIGSAAEPAGSRYEIQYRLLLKDKRKPLIRFFDFDRLSGNRIRVDVDIDSGGQSFMGTASIRATANRRLQATAPIADISNPDGPFPQRTFNTDRIKFEYTFRLKRPVTRLVIRAENRAGIVSKKVKRYRLRIPREERSPYPRLNLASN